YKVPSKLLIITFKSSSHSANAASHPASEPPYNVIACISPRVIRARPESASAIEPGLEQPRIDVGTAPSCRKAPSRCSSLGSCIKCSARYGNLDAESVPAQADNKSFHDWLDGMYCPSTLTSLAISRSTSTATSSE